MPVTYKNKPFVSKALAVSQALMEKREPFFADQSSMAASAPRADVLHLSPCPPVYAPGPWNDRAMQFNCYAYALRLPQAGRAVPGSLSRIMTLSMDFTAAHMDIRLQHDGLCRIREHSNAAANAHIVAAFLSPSVGVREPDYHFYSFDRDGTWSHKAGMAEVGKLDAAGQVIDNPERAARRYLYHNYSEFVGYYAIPAGGIVYTPKIDAFTP